MPSQGHNYSPFPPNTLNANAPNPPNTTEVANASNATNQVPYYPYYPSDPSQYYSQYYSPGLYYQMPAQTTSYAQAYIDAAYSAAFPQVSPLQQVQPLAQVQPLRSNHQQSWKKNPDRLPVAYCNECSKPFYTNLDYQNHLKCHVSCPDCGLTLTKKQLMPHRNEAHPKTLEDPKEIASYIAERKGKYPSSNLSDGKEKTQNLAWKNPTLENDQEGSKKRKLVVSVGYCKFFPLGKCKKGAGCPYYHESPTDQELKRVVVSQSQKSTEKNKKKSKETTKLAPKDRSKLFQLLNQEFMQKDDSVLLQFIRYSMDNIKS